MVENKNKDDPFTKEDEERAKQDSFKEMAERDPVRLKRLLDVKAEGYLKDPNFWGLIDAEFDKKIEGEKEARKAIFFTFNMRNVLNLSKATDNLMINDEGGTGKDYVVSAVFDILPDSEKDKRVRITPKVLVYLNDMKNNPIGWTKKCLYLEDVPNEVLNDDAFKVMSSADPNGITQTSIVINNTLKDINIVGKPPIILTIATANPKQELLRRYPICNLTSTIKQTKAILKKQAKFAMEGKAEGYNYEIKSALRLLARIKVKIPFADKIYDVFPAENVIIRTHFPRFMDYIKSSCALFQFQREQDKEGYYLATEQDYEIAREIMAVTTSNQLMIPLPKIQKSILEKLEGSGNIRFSFEELEEKLQNIASDRWLRYQLQRLTELGFLKRGNEKKEGIKKPIAVYSYNEYHKLELPNFKELTKHEFTSNKTMTSFNSINSINSNNGYNPSSDYLNNLNNLNGEVGKAENEYTKRDHFLKSLSTYPKGMEKDIAISLWGEELITKTLEEGSIYEIPKGVLNITK